MGGVDDLQMWVDLYTLRCESFTQVWRPGVEVEAWPSVVVVVVVEWPRGDVIAGTGGRAGERVRGHSGDFGRSSCVWVGRSGVVVMMVLPSRGASLTDEVGLAMLMTMSKGNLVHGLVRLSALGRGTGHIKSCGVQKIPGRVQSRLCRRPIAIAALLRWTKMSWWMM